MSKNHIIDLLMSNVMTFEEFKAKRAASAITNDNPMNTEQKYDKALKDFKAKYVAGTITSNDLATFTIAECDRDIERWKKFCASLPKDDPVLKDLFQQLKNFQEIYTGAYDELRVAYREKGSDTRKDEAKCTKIQLAAMHNIKDIKGKIYRRAAELKEQTQQQESLEKFDEAVKAYASDSVIKELKDHLDKLVTDVQQAYKDMQLAINAGDITKTSELSQSIISNMHVIIGFKIKLKKRIDQLKKDKEEKEMSKKEQILAALKSAKTVVVINDNNEATVYTQDDIVSILPAVPEKETVPVTPKKDDTASSPVVPKKVTPSAAPKKNPFISVKPKAVVPDSQKTVPSQETAQNESKAPNTKAPSTKRPNLFVTSVKQKKEAFAAASAPTDTSSASTNEERIKELQSQRVLKPHEAKELKKLMGDEAYTTWKKGKEQAFLKRLANSPIQKKMR